MTTIIYALVILFVFAVNRRSQVTGKGINRLYLILSIAFWAAGEFVSLDAGNPLEIAFYIVSTILLVISVYGLVTKIK